MARSVRTILELARENGFLNATGNNDPTALLRAHGRWCWRLRIPMVWFERRTPRSRYGSVFLEMFTTGSRLTPSGLKKLRSLAQGEVSADVGCWEGLPLDALGGLARQVYRLAVEAGNTVSKPAARGAPSRCLTASA